MSFPSEYLHKEFLSKEFIELQDYYNAQHMAMADKFMNDYIELSKCIRCKTHLRKKWKIRANHFIIILEKGSKTFIHDKQFPSITWYVDEALPPTKLWVYDDKIINKLKGKRR